MTNPYKTPSSELENHQLDRKLRWKILFWIVFILEILSFGLLIAEDSLFSFKTICEVLVYIPVLLGLFGYAYNKAILFPAFWKILIPVGVIYDAWMIFDDFKESALESDPSFAIAVFGVVIILFLPMMFFQYLALYYYSQNKNNIWAGDKS